MHRCARILFSLGFHLEKGHSAVDWSTRPLPEPWLRYAALDVSGAARSNEVAFTAVVVLDGQVAGWWRRSVGKESATVEVALFEPPDGAVRVALTAAVERYGAFLEMPVTLALR